MGVSPQDARSETHSALPHPLLSCPCPLHSVKELSRESLDRCTGRHREVLSGETKEELVAGVRREIVAGERRNVTTARRVGARLPPQQLRGSDRRVLSQHSLVRPWPRIIKQRQAWDIAQWQSTSALKTQCRIKKEEERGEGRKEGKGKGGGGKEQRNILAT